jgi:CubicO group peptidase (beta-lactamase class C family)
MDVPVSGRCDPAFESVRRQFQANFTDRGEVGAGVCVMVDGEVVVDLVGGWTDEGRTRPWQPDTIVNFYSVGKPIVATLALQLVDDGLIGLDDPVADIWPEFATGGKHGATLRQALCHQAGVPAIREPLTDDSLWEWSRMADAVAATEAWWVPGTMHAYHTNTYGHLIGEVVRRVTGQLPGERLRALAASLDADLWFGLPAVEQSRCADVIFASEVVPDVSDLDAVPDDARMMALGYFNPPGYSSIGVVNTTRWRATEIPSTNGHGTAGGVARFYAALLEPGRVLSPELLHEATSAQSEGFCAVLGEEVTFGLGFKPTTSRRPFGPNPRSFGHFGSGGALGFADPDTGVAFGYVMNDVIPRWQSTRNRALMEAVYGSH